MVSFESITGTSIKGKGLMRIVHFLHLFLAATQSLFQFELMVVAFFFDLLQLPFFEEDLFEQRIGLFLALFSDLFQPIFIEFLEVDFTSSGCFSHGLVLLLFLNQRTNP